MVKSSQIKQQPHRSSGFVFKCSKRAWFMSNLLKTDCDIATVYCFLTGSNLCHGYAASHANRQIKNWWSHSKRSNRL